ncbi:hypothetical protein [Flammeovirga sp. SubArs3]|uniref:hypothetical protein n=1 Tax=Flammeovirga sp. SubArs3 TaxID=2995316 RepID=UPI00248CA271|nr:hypothetical protein [Flammeovirga sp. SubArs3]
MKPNLQIFLLFISISVFGQKDPNVTFASQNLIQGTGVIGTTIKISTNLDDTSEHEVVVDEKGNFKFTFPTLLPVGDNIVVWAVNSDDEVVSQRILMKIEESNTILQNFSDGKISNNSLRNFSAAGKTVKYKATIWNTNFSIPLARFNFTKDNDQKTGDLLLFNSIGAGFGISKGELSETRDQQGNLLNQEFINTFGIHLGFLFSAGTGDDTKNVFAPTLNFSVLNFQMGIGYELGTRSEDQLPAFLTLSYAIPVYKLTKGGFWIWKNSKPITDPMQSRQGE